MDFPHPDLAEFCLEKSNGKTIVLNKNDTIKQKIDYLKEEGITYSNGDLLQLLDIINKQNIINIDLNPAFSSSRQEFENVLNSMIDSDSYPCNKDIIELFKQITDSYSVEDETKYSFQVTNIINRKNNEILSEIVDFFQLHKIENLKSRRKR